MDRDRRERQAHALRHRRTTACRAPRQRLFEARGAARSGGSKSSLCGQTRSSDQADLRTLSIQPVGLVLQYGRIVVLLAPHSRAVLRARLPCRGRGVPSRGAQPFGAVLALGEGAVSGSPAGQGLARRARHRSAPLWPSRAPRRDRQLKFSFGLLAPRLAFAGLLRRTDSVRCSGLGADSSPPHRSQSLISLTVLAPALQASLRKPRSVPVDT